MSESGPVDAISVVILSHNRCALVQREIDSILTQDFPEIEVILIDNASTDDTVEQVRSRYPQVSIVANPSNQVMVGRNLGLKAARHPIVLTLDDDVELRDSGTLRSIVAQFAADPRLGALTLKITEEASGDEFAPSHWWHPLDRKRYQDRSFETDCINEAAVAFRADALKHAGYYFEPLSWGGEEWDLVLGLYDAGYSVRYAPEPVRHLAPRGNINRNADPRHTLILRNRCWIALRRLPYGKALAFMASRLPLWFLRSLRFGYLRFYLRGLFELLIALPTILASRQPISRSALRAVTTVRRRARVANRRGRAYERSALDSGLQGFSPHRDQRFWCNRHPERVDGRAGKEKP